MNYWIIKSEPKKYSWEQMVLDKQTFWDGVRNYQARNNLMAMKKGDIALFYHSNEGKEIVGRVKIVKEAYQDPTTEDERWVAVDVKLDKKYKNAISLSELKSTPGLENIGLVRQGRLSVMPITELEFKIIESIGSL